MALFWTPRTASKPGTQNGARRHNQLWRGPNDDRTRTARCISKQNLHRTIEINAKMCNARRISRFTAISPMLALAMIGSLSACDPLYGVRRTAPIDVDPTIECVERVLRATPGIQTVEYKHSTGGSPLTWAGIKSPTLVESFSYQGPSNVRGVLQYTKDYAGRFMLVQTDLPHNAQSRICT